MRRSPLRSPPRMRGKAKNRCRSCPLTRITPACAGKRTCTATRRCGNGNHPRVCGEKMVSMIPHRRSRGSPPRVRGKGIKRGCHSHQCGITPACAGKSAIKTPVSVMHQDHPRVCGEKVPKKPCQSDRRGSPPRVRGKDSRTMGYGGSEGITPACAGKSLRRWKTDSFLRDHPRVCGEKHFPHGINITLRGSPPRVRGKALSKEETPITDGITPACAGKRHCPRFRP